MTAEIQALGLSGKSNMFYFRIHPMLYKSNEEYIQLIDTKGKQSSRAISEDHLMIVHWPS